MKLRIGVNNCRKQFAGVGRYDFCDFQYGVQYQFPYPVRGGQLESISRGFTEEGSDGLVGLKTLHRTQYVVLHHRQREAGNLCGEMYTLALAEVQQLLAVVICHLGSPAHGVRPVCLEKTEREVCGEQSVPLSLPSPLREEQADGGSCELHINGAVGALQCPVVLCKPLLLELLDNLVGRQVAPLGVVLGLAKLNHAYQMALDVAARYEPHEGSTGKPAVNEQIVESDTPLDGILHHLYGLVGLLHGVLPDTLFHALARVVGRETLTALFVRQPLSLSRLASLLTMDGEVKEQLAQAVAQQQRQALVAQDALVLKVGEYLADELALATALRGVSIIDNQANRLVMTCLRTATDLACQLEVHSIQQLTPFNVTVIHKTIEHVLLTTEQAA